MTRIFNILLASLFIATTALAQPVPQNKKVTEAFYQDPEIEINTPAVLKKKGFTTYDEMMAFFNDLKAAHGDLMTIEFIGKSQKEVEIAKVTLTNKASNKQKVKVWMQGGLHGNEPASTEGMLFLMQQLLTNDTMKPMLDELEIAIVPMANIDGFEKQDRLSANGLDLNRDQTKLEAPESIALKQAFSDFGAEVAVDFHEYRPYRRDYSAMGNFGIAGYYDVMLLYSGNLNVPEIMRQYTNEVFIGAVRNTLSKMEYSYHNYFTSEDYHGETHLNEGSFNSRSSATNYSLTNAVSALIEIRGIGLNKVSFKRRIYSTYQVAYSFLNTAIREKATLKANIAKAAQSMHDAVPTSKRAIIEKPIEFIDIETSKVIEITMIVHDANQMTPTLSRKRPTAYLIKASEAKAAEKLQILGLKVTKLEKTGSISAEKYSVTEYESDLEKYEGIYRQHVKTETSETQVNYEVGDFLVEINADQAKSNLAIEVLEPEGPNSFVSFRVIETELKQELPIYRILTPFNP